MIERDGAAVGFYNDRFCIFPAATDFLAESAETGGTGVVFG